MRGPYTLVIEGEEYVPSSFGKLRQVVKAETVWNPDQLYEGAIRQAERVAFDLVSPGESVEIEIVGRVGRGGRDSVNACRVVAFEQERGIVTLTSPSYKWGTEIRRRGV